MSNNYQNYQIQKIKVINKTGHPAYWTRRKETLNCQPTKLLCHTIRRCQRLGVTRWGKFVTLFASARLYFRKIGAFSRGGVSLSILISTGGNFHLLWNAPSKEDSCWRWNKRNSSGGGDSRHFGPMRLLFLIWCRECFAACVVFSFSFQKKWKRIGYAVDLIHPAQLKRACWCQDLQWGSK